MDALLERIAMEVLGPQTESDHGNKYILLVADYLTRWTESYPMPNPTVAKPLVGYFVVRFGVARHLYSDQVRNVETVVFGEMCLLLDIDKIRTTPLRL